MSSTVTNRFANTEKDRNGSADLEDHNEQDEIKEHSESSCNRCCHCLLMTFVVIICLTFLLIRFIAIPFLSGFFGAAPINAYASFNNDNDDDNENWTYNFDPEDDSDDESTIFQNEDGSIHIQMNGNGGQDIFSSIFGGIFGNNRVHKEVIVTLKDIYVGTKRTEYIQLSHTCSTCGGRGMKGHVCSQCGGQGIIMSNMGFMHCPRCNGQGFIPESQCPVCHGQGRITENVPVQLDILKGTEDGHIYKERYNNERLQIRLRIQEHSLYKRDKNDLRIVHTITLGESLFGFTHEMIHLDGHKYYISSKRIISDGEVLKIPYEGMPYYNSNSKFGNLYVTIKIQFPTSLTEEEKSIIRDNLPEN